MKRLRMFVLIASMGLAPALAGAGQAVPGEARLLVATEAMSDPRFAEAVILMLDHDATGAMGLIVNKAIGEGYLRSFLDGFAVTPENPAADFASRRLKLFYGGPVEGDSVFVIHGTDYMGPSSRGIGGGLAVSSEIEVLEDLASGRGPKRYRVVLGYAGWAAGQLEGEMASREWLTAPATAAEVLADDAEAIWARVRKGAGLAL